MLHCGSLAFSLRRLEEAPVSNLEPHFEALLEPQALRPWALFAPPREPRLLSEQALEAPKSNLEPHLEPLLEPHFRDFIVYGSYPSFSGGSKRGSILAKRKIVLRKERPFSYRRKSLFWSLPKTGFAKESGRNRQNEAPKEARNRFGEPLSLSGGPGPGGPFLLHHDHGSLAFSLRRLQEAPKSNLEPPTFL